MVIGRTSAVGAFPLGKSPYDLQDMSGNVWEWTRSNYKNYEYDPKDGRENMEAEKNVARVLRGGAYLNEGVYLRCAFRLRDSPYLRYFSFGFRCVVCASFMLLMWKTHRSRACMFRSEMRLIHGWPPRPQRRNSAVTSRLTSPPAPLLAGEGSKGRIRRI